MPGLPAYFGLFEIGRPIVGDTVVISAASGAVGAVVGQLAKFRGCRVIGIAGTDEKINYVADELGFDATPNYKTEDIPTRLGALCPDDIDIYWDNVGGELADAAIERIASGGRVVICGQIAQYNVTSPIWVRDGALKYGEDVVVGIENSSAAFIGLLHGANLGKLVVQLK